MDLLAQPTVQGALKRVNNEGDKNLSPFATRHSICRSDLQVATPHSGRSGMWLESPSLRPCIVGARFPRPSPVALILLGDQGSEF